MTARFPFLQSLTRWVTGSDLPEDDAPEDNPADSSQAAIDIWAYAEPAGEEPDPLKRNVLQWRRLITSVRDPLALFPGQPVDVIGFVHRPLSSVPQQFVLARRIIRCCLADTVPLGLVIHTDLAGDYENERWLRIQGVFDTVAVANKLTLVVIPDVIQTLSEPKKVYINGVF